MQVPSDVQNEHPWSKLRKGRKSRSLLAKDQPGKMTSPQSSGGRLNTAVFCSLQSMFLME